MTNKTLFRTLDASSIENANMELPALNGILQLSKLLIELCCCRCVVGIQDSDLPVERGANRDGIERWEPISVATKENASVMVQV